MKILIKSGLVIDSSRTCEEARDVFVENSVVTDIEKKIARKADLVIDAKGKIVMPGLVDMHVHLREPGREDKETIETGTKAAIKGGVTCVLAMPNTQPAIDCIHSVQAVKNIVAKTAVASVYIAAAMTKGRLGKEPVPIAELIKEGAAAFTDDGNSVDSDEVMEEILKQIKKENSLAICHCEDKALSKSGAVNLGVVSTRMGLRGISKESEYKRIERDIRLAERTGAGIHIAHVSCEESVALIAQAKKRGVRVTCETAAHYFSLSEEDVQNFDTNKKINPPLRTKGDVKAIIQGLRDGTVDVIASDHAPHTENEKDIEFDRAEFGVTGLETELAVSISSLIKTKELSWTDLVNKMAANPAGILGIKKGRLCVGCDADLIIVSPEQEWIVTKDGFVSRSVNSAFLGRKLCGVVEYTLRGGEIVYQNEASSHK